MNRKLIILAILLCFPVMLLAKPPEDRIKEKDVVGVKTEVYYQKAKEVGVVTEISGVVKIKPADWKDIKIKDRIDLRILDEVGTETQQAQKIKDKTENDTTLRGKVAVIVREEVMPQPLDLLEIDLLALTTLTIDQMQVKLQGMTQPELSRLSVAIYNFRTQNQSRELDKALQLIRTKQYPVLGFPFLETTSDDPSVYIVKIDDEWVDIIKMQEMLKTGKVKLVMLMSDWLNNAAVTEIGGSIEDFPLKSKSWEIPYQAAKEVAPNVPVGFIAVMKPGLETWLTSFSIKPDVWCLFNVPTFGTNWQKVKNRWFADKPVIANLNHEWNGNQIYGSTEYNATVTTLKALGFAGSIFWR